MTSGTAAARDQADENQRAAHELNGADEWTDGPGQRDSDLRESACAERIWVHELLDARRALMA
jgi:hypothetical protein